MNPWLLVAAWCSLSCSGALNAGYDDRREALPVDSQSATVVVNDGARDNWQGEYAALLAASGRLQWVGLVVNASAEYPTLETNVTGYREMLSAAAESGMSALPEATASDAPPLVRPASGAVEDTVPNRSEGARLIVQAVADWATTARPLTIATGGALTDVADAWLLDPSIAERVVVVASLGRTAEDGRGAITADPNGARDSWATQIVTSKLPFVQVSGFYDQRADIPEERVAELPSNAFGDWLVAKRDGILGLIQACDQISVLSAALPGFARTVTRMRVREDDPSRLEADPLGPIWHVSSTDFELARRELWQILLTPGTYE